MNISRKKGKCYNDGHRHCKVSLSIDEVSDNICPVCGKPLTIVVAHRVEQLANKSLANAEETVQPFQYVLPLPEVFAGMKGTKAVKPLSTKIVRDIYSKAISFFGNEFDILHHVSLEDVHRYHLNLSIAIERLRNNQKHFTVGFDGEYGRIYFFNEGG